MRSLIARALMLVPLVAVACKSSSTGPGGSTLNLAGNYSLLTFQELPNPAVDTLFANGTLALTTNTYHLNLNVHIPAPGDTIVLVDSGTYTLHGDSIAEQSQTGNPDALGTVSVNGSTLTISVTESLISIVTTWHKH